MTKQEFMNELERLIQAVPDKKEVLYDYEEHFQIGSDDGKTEEEIAESLGSPKSIAKELLAEYHINQAKENQTAGNITRAVIASLSLGFFNLVFVLGPFLGIVGVLIGLYVTTAALILTPFGILFGNMFFGQSEDWLLAIFMMMASGGVGVLMAVGMIYLTRGMYLITVKYLQFNLKIIRGKA
jgi:uncharacterized membrane protein